MTKSDIENYIYTYSDNIGDHYIAKVVEIYKDSLNGYFYFLMGKIRKMYNTEMVM